jgi:hypothetical protein
VADKHIGKEDLVVRPTRVLQPNLQRFSKARQQFYYGVNSANIFAGYEIAQDWRCLQNLL